MGVLPQILQCAIVPSSETYSFSILWQLMIVTKFVGDNRNYLRQYESSYCLVLNAAVNVQKNDAMFDALRTIGVILLLRDVSSIGCIFSVHAGASQLKYFTWLTC